LPGFCWLSIYGPDVVRATTSQTDVSCCHWLGGGKASGRAVSNRLPSIENSENLGFVARVWGSWLQLQRREYTLETDHTRLTPRILLYSSFESYQLTAVIAKSFAPILIGHQAMMES